MFSSFWEQGSWWNRVAFKIPLIYGGVSILYILFSDRLLLLVSDDPSFLTRIQILKGWAFVLLTALFLAYLLRREMAKLEASQRALVESEAKFRAIFNQTFQFVGLLDPEGRVLASNDSALSFVGIRQEEVFGKLCWETPWWSHSEEERSKLKEGVARAAKGEFVRFETTHLGRDGGMLVIDFSLKPVAGPGGEILFLIPEGRDITDRKRMERELEDHRDHLERLVEVRTAALETAQAELFRREKLATLGRLTSTVSHELRNPLGTVRNALYTLNLNLSPEIRTDQIQRSLDFAGRNIVRCVEIIEQLLDFAREKPVRLAPGELAPFVKGTVDQWRVQNNHEVETACEDSGCIRLDPEFLSAAVRRILDNAREAVAENPPEDAKITVRIRRSEDRMEIEIEDNGAGIPPDLAEKVREPLFTTKGFGVGLGIPWAEEIVQQHGGTIRFENREGGGTRVILSLPAAMPAEEERAG